MHFYILSWAALVIVQISANLNITHCFFFEINLKWTERQHFKYGVLLFHVEKFLQTSWLNGSFTDLWTQYSQNVQTEVMNGKNLWKKN